MLQIVARETRATSDEASLAVLVASLIAVSLSIVTMLQFTKRIIEPAEIAALIRFLASPEASAITGQTYNIDGGQTMG